MRREEDDYCFCYVEVFFFGKSIYNFNCNDVINVYL